MASNFSMIPIHWLLTLDSEMVFFSFSSRSLRMCLFSFKTHSVQEKNYCQTGELQSKLHWKKRCRTHRFMIHAISVFSVKFTMEFTSWAMNFCIEESKEND